MARYCVAYSICQINGNRLARFLKRLLDEWNPMFLGYLLHEYHLSEAIERTVGIVEDVEHHISLAAVETVRGELLLLPYGAHFSFHVLVFWEISQLLELVYADDNLDTFSFASISGSCRIVILSRSCGTNFLASSIHRSILEEAQAIT